MSCPECEEAYQEGKRDGWQEAEDKIEAAKTASDAELDAMQSGIDALHALLRRAQAVLASLPASVLAEQGEAYLISHIAEALK